MLRNAKNDLQHSLYSLRLSFQPQGVQREAQGAQCAFPRSTAFHRDLRVFFAPFAVQFYRKVRQGFDFNRQECMGSAQSAQRPKPPLRCISPRPLRILRALRGSCFTARSARGSILTARNAREARKVRSVLNPRPAAFHLHRDLRVFFAPFAVHVLPQGPLRVRF